MALTQEELDRKKFSGEGTGITRKPVPTMKGMLGAADRAIGRGVDAVAGVPGKVMNAITPERRGYSGEVNPVAAVGGFVSRMARSAPNTFGGAEAAAVAGMDQRNVGQAQPVPGSHRGPGADSQRPVTPQEQQVMLQPYGVKRRPEMQQQPEQVQYGWASTPNDGVYGGRVLSFGQPGQDGGGYGYQSGPARQAVDLGRVAAENRMGSGHVGGYSFEGSGADFAKFARQPTRPALQGGNTAASERPIYQQVRDRYEGGRGAEMPKYLGPESGIGWKTRLAKYQAELDAYEKATGNRAAMDLEAMRQAGAGQRSIADANARAAENQAQLAEQRRQFDEQAPGRQADAEAKQLEAGYSRMKSELAQRWQQATDPKEKEALYRQMLGLEGKEPRSNIETVDVPNPDDPTGGTMKVPARINPDGTYTRLQEQGGQQADPWARIQSNPARLNAFNALPPEKKAEFIQKLYQ